MNKEILREFRSRYKTEASVLKRIDWCLSRPKHKDDIPFLYAILGEIRVKNRHKNNQKLANNKRSIKYGVRDKERQLKRKYALSMNELIACTALDTYCPQTKKGKPTQRVYQYYQFFFPLKNMKRSGELTPIDGFTEDVSLDIIDAFIKTDIKYNVNCYKIFCKNRVSGKWFVKLYNDGADDYEKFFPGAPRALLAKLYNNRQGSSAAVGNGEYLMRLKINDLNKEKYGDICTRSGVNLEMKAAGGRLSGQKHSSDVHAMDSALNHLAGLYPGTISMLGYGMIDAYNTLHIPGLSDVWTKEKIINLFAKCKVKTYKDISKEDQELFIRNMTENWDAFFFDGEFTKKSVDWINACYDCFVYPRLSGWNYIKIDSPQPEVKVKNREKFDVHFKIFSKDDFVTPGMILRLLEEEKIIPSGTIKNNGRDKAVHVDIK